MNNNYNALRQWVKENGAWNNSHTIYICKSCNRHFQKSPSAEAKFCSQKCYAEDMKKRKGAKSSAWKGDNVGYFGLHVWVRKNLGNASFCVKCGSNQKVQWANRSHKYKRDLFDWIALCFACHRKYDSGKNWGKAKEKYVKFAFI